MASRVQEGEEGSQVQRKNQSGGGAVAQGLGGWTEEELWEGGGAGGLVGWRWWGSPAAMETQTKSVRVDFSGDSARRLSFQRPLGVNSYAHRHTQKADSVNCVKKKDGLVLILSKWFTDRTQTNTTSIHFSVTAHPALRMRRCWSQSWARCHFGQVTRSSQGHIRATTRYCECVWSN